MSDEQFITQALELIKGVEVENVKDLSGKRDEWVISLKNDNDFYELTLIDDCWEITTSQNDWIDSVPAGFKDAVRMLAAFILDAKIDELEKLGSAN